MNSETKKILKRARFYLTAIRHGDLGRTISQEVESAIRDTGRDLTDIIGLEEAGAILTDLAESGSLPGDKELYAAIAAVTEYEDELTSDNTDPENVYGSATMAESIAADRK